MIRDFLNRRRQQATNPTTADEAAGDSLLAEGRDYDYHLNRNTSSPGYGIFTGDLYLYPRGFLTQATADALYTLLGESQSDAKASLVRITQWRPPTDKQGKPVPMSQEEKAGYAADVTNVVRYVVARQKPSVNGEHGMGKIFFGNLNAAMKEHGSDDPVALLEQFDTLPEAVLNHFNASERDALRFPEIRAKTIPVASEYVQLQKLSLALRKEATAALGEEAMQPKTVRPEPSGSRSSSSFLAKERPRPGMNGGVGVRCDNGHLQNGNGR